MMSAVLIIEYFMSLIFGARSEGRKTKWNWVKKELSK